MKLFTKDILAKLAANGAASAARETDHRPVLKVFNPTGAATWLISESDPNEPDRLFALCDLGMGEPELGYVLRSELESVRGRFGLPLERDLHFTADKTLTEYADEARSCGRINA